jgi:hypothetical protein
VNLVDELHTIARTLHEAGIQYAVCGGLAVTIHGATRTTKDIDLLVAASEVPRILELVRRHGYLFAALPMTFEGGTPRERHVQRVSKIEGTEHLILDLIVADASLAGLLEGREEIALPEGPLAVVSRPTLLTMKRLAGRPQDLADLAALERDGGQPDDR